MTVPALVRHVFPPEVALQVRPLPLPARPVDVTMQWHRRHEADAAHRWLRDLVEGLLRERLRG